LHNNWWERDVASAISFSGFNNIDFGSIVNALIQQASAPLTALQTSQTALKSQVTNYSTLGSRVAALNSAAAALGDLTSVNAFSGTSSDSSAVGVSTTSDARAGHYDVVVSALARAQVTVSTSSAADADTTIVASGGTLTLGGVDVAVTGDVTLQQLADTINATDGIGVTATVIRTATNTYRLALTSSETGLDNAFTVTNNLTGGSGVTFGANAVDAADASLTINNVAVTSSSNTLESVVSGVTLTLGKQDAGTTIGIDIAPDSSGLKTKVEAFITAYNSLASFAEDQRSAATSGDASSIGNDPLLRQLRNALRSAIGAAYGTSDVSRLSQAGIEFTQTGTLQLNDTVFTAAVTSNPVDVQDVFAGASGVFPSIKTMLDDYSASTGYINTATTQLNAQIQRMTSQISDMQDRLAQQKIALQQEFAAADAAIKALNNQSSALTNFSASLGSSL
jgi:flagellar hook-associated protein 2